ncbi:hypothetical protein BpHYR1_035582 [Brachionus plicatilis]|uniref:Uncharacterized protein n=1 Tax=Brachionus plicatilis TaxID=10195 RepID=A0A3M7R9S0_BRAPC|nr:hypothetical protein BpHYR1_035582 [Brachionus plicatilis]
MMGDSTESKISNYTVVDDLLVHKNLVDCYEKIIQEISELNFIQWIMKVVSVYLVCVQKVLETRVKDEEENEEELLEDEPNELDDTWSLRLKSNNTHLLEDQFIIDSVDAEWCNIQSCINCKSLLMIKNAFVNIQVSSEAEAKVTESLESANEDLLRELCSVKDHEYARSPVHINFCSPIKFY